MPFTKIRDFPQRMCLHPEHNPPSHQVMENGVYEYKCPGCGNVTVVVVYQPSWAAKRYDPHNPDALKVESPFVY